MLAIAGGKGGCGKTTVTLGLAAAYGRRRERPLAVDVDADAPNLHLVAGVPSEPCLDAVADGVDPGEVAHAAPRFRDVDVLPAGRPGSVRTALARLPADRPVLVDCPAGASRAVAGPIGHADGVLLVTTPDRETVEDALKTAAMAKALGTPVVGVAYNRTETAPTAAVAAAFDSPVRGTVPTADSDPVAATRAAFDGIATAIGPNP